MFNGTIALNGLLYGCSTFARCGIMNQVGIFTNYGMILICWYRYGMSILLFSYLTCVAALSIAAYHVDTTLVGLSCVWNFHFGYANNKNSMDYAFFIFSNVSVIVAYYIFPWPWSYCFVWKSIAAHCAAAWLGHLCKPCMTQYTSRKMQDTRLQSTNRFDVFTNN